MADPMNTSATSSPNLGWKLHFDPKDANEETLAALDAFIGGTGHEFKRVGLPGGGEASGKYYTVYPQSLEARDKFIGSLEELNSKTNLLREIGPDFQLEGNTKLTPRISGRFTTGYSSFDPETGLPLFGKSQTAPNEAIASDTMKRAGKVNHYIKDSWTAPPSTHTEMTRGYGLRVTAEELAEDTRLLQEKYPSVYELLAGKPGYKSPYEPLGSSMSFETSMGSIYTRDSSGRISRQKSTGGSTMEASTSSFDRTVFVSPEDVSAVKIGYERGLRPLEDGTLQGLDYNRDKLDNVKFGGLRKQGVSFDEAYTSSGGTITPRNITPELQPKIGYNPFEYNLEDKKFHAGNEIVRINEKDSLIPQTSAPNIEDLRKLGSSGTVEASPTPNPSAEALIRTMRGEIADRDRLAEESLPATRKAVEEDGFLYHYAPKSRRDSIAKHGIVSNQSDTAAQGPGKSFFFVNPEGHTLSQFAPDVASADPDAGLDLYRVKASEEMLDQLKVDSHLPLRDGIGQSVYLEGDIAKGGFSAELISDKVDISTGEIIPKIKDIDDKKTKTVADAVKSEAVIETNKTGEPIIKVGKVVESKGEKVKDSKPKINIADAALDVKDSVVEAAVASATKDETEDEKEIGEVVSEKISDKIDPIAKIEGKVEGKKEKAKKALIDNLVDEDNKRFAAETASAAPSDRLASAAGRAPTTTGSAPKVLAIDSLASGSLTDMSPRVATKTLMADASSMSKSLASGMKNSKNLRLAATAALLSATGFGIAKFKGRSAGAESQQYSPDEEMELRRSLIDDG